MIRIVDKGGSYHVEVFRVPALPPDLALTAEVQKLAGPAEDAEFVKWWAKSALLRGYKHTGIPSSEEWVHARRLLSKYTPAQLRNYAVEYFIEDADERWVGAKLLRMFAYSIPQIEERLEQHN